jgi:hypothetical protein
MSAVDSLLLLAALALPLQKSPFIDYFSITAAPVKNGGFWNKLRVCF